MLRSRLHYRPDGTVHSRSKSGRSSQAFMGDGKVCQTLANFLMAKKLPNVVLDPILKSSSGTDLLDKSGKRILIDRLLPLATLITPNVAEAAVLTGVPVTNPDQMQQAAAKLHAMGAKSVVVTGGDLDKAI